MLSWPPMERLLSALLRTSSLQPWPLQQGRGCSACHPKPTLGGTGGPNWAAVKQKSAGRTPDNTGAQSGQGGEALSLLLSDLSMGTPVPYGTTQPPAARTAAWVKAPCTLRVQADAVPVCGMGVCLSEQKLLSTVPRVLGVQTTQVVPEAQAPAHRSVARENSLTRTSANSRPETMS